MGIVVCTRDSANVWRKNVLEDLEKGNETVGKFLVYLKKEFGEENNKTIKVEELKRIKQRNRMIEKFI